LVAITSIIYGCKKVEEAKSNSLTKINYELLQEVRNFKSNRAVLVAYATLSATEKAEIWKENLNYYINNGELTVNQINHLEKLKTKLNASIFQKPDNSFLPYGRQWVNEGLKYFSKQQLEVMLSSLTLNPLPSGLPQTNGLETDPIGGTGDKPNCNCKSSNSVLTTCSGSNEK